MPRYYFHVEDGYSSPDDVGTEFTDLHQARLEAVKFASKLIEAHAYEIVAGHGWSMKVENESGSIVFYLDILATEPRAERIELTQRS